MLELKIFIISSLASLMLLVVFYTIYTMNQKIFEKKDEIQHQLLLDSLKVNDYVLLKSGIFGKVVALGNDTIEIEISNENVITVIKTAVVRKETSK